MSDTQSIPSGVETILPGAVSVWCPGCFSCLSPGDTCEHLQAVTAGTNGLVVIQHSGHSIVLNPVRLSPP